MFGMKFEALCALLLIRGQQGLVSESVWVGVGGQMSGPNVSPGDWEMRADTLERRMVKATRAILMHRDLSHPALLPPHSPGFVYRVIKTLVEYTLKSLINLDQKLAKRLFFLTDFLSWVLSRGQQSFL